MKISSIKIISVIFFFILFVDSSMIGLSSTVGGWINNALSLLLLWIFRDDCRRFIFVEKNKVGLLLLLYCVICVYSVYLNKEFISQIDAQAMVEGTKLRIEGNTRISSVIYPSIGIITALVFIKRMIEEDKIQIVIRTLTLCMGILVFLINYDAFTMDDVESGAGYIVRDKFYVCYYNLFLCVLFYLGHPKLRHASKLVFLFLCLMMFAVSMHTKCSTMVIGTVIFGTLTILFSNRWKSHLYNMKVLFIVLFLCDIFFFFFIYRLLQIPSVQDFLVNVLHEDITLTGRVFIYAEIQKVLIDSPYFGYGFGNSFIITEYFINAPNVQNGLGDLFLQVGIVGCLCFLCILYLLFKPIEKQNYNVFPVVAFIYTMLVVSMVEIPFNNRFLFFSFFLLIPSSVFQHKRI